jgi:hypothetical protein
MFDGKESFKIQKRHGHSGFRWRSLQANRELFEMKFLPFWGEQFWPAWIWNPDPLTHLNPDPIKIRIRNTIMAPL